MGAFGTDNLDELIKQAVARLPHPQEPVIYLGDGAYLECVGESFRFMANSHLTPDQKVYVDFEAVPKMIAWIKQQMASKGQG